MTTVDSNGTESIFDFLEADWVPDDDTSFEIGTALLPDKWKDRYLDELNLWEVVDSYSSNPGPVLQEKAPSGVTSLSTSTLSTTDYQLTPNISNTGFCVEDFFPELLETTCGGQNLPALEPTSCGGKLTAIHENVTKENIKNTGAPLQELITSEYKEQPKGASEKVSSGCVPPKKKPNMTQGEEILEGNNGSVKNGARMPQLSTEKGQGNVACNNPVKVKVRIVEKAKVQKRTKRKIEDVRNDTENLGPIPQLPREKGQGSVVCNNPVKVRVRIVEKAKAQKRTKRKIEDVRNDTENIGAPLQELITSEYKGQPNVASETSSGCVMPKKKPNTTQGEEILEDNNGSVKNAGRTQICSHIPQLSREKGQGNVGCNNPMKVKVRIVEKAKVQTRAKRKIEDVRNDTENIDPGRIEVFKRCRKTQKPLPSSYLSDKRPATQKHVKFCVPVQGVVSDCDMKTRNTTTPTYKTNANQMPEALKDVADTRQRFSAPSSSNEKATKTPQLLFAVPALDDVLPHRDIDFNKVLPHGHEVKGMMQLLSPDAASRMQKIIHTLTLYRNIAPKASTIQVNSAESGTGKKVKAQE